MREWDRGKTRPEDDLDAPVTGGPRRPLSSPRATRGRSSPLPRARRSPRGPAEKPAATPAARRLEQWRRDAERGDRTRATATRPFHGASGGGRGTRPTGLARARREAREADAARARAGPERGPRAGRGRRQRRRGWRGIGAGRRGALWRRLLDALVDAGPPGWFLDARDVARRRRYRDREREEEVRDEEKLAELEARGDAESPGKDAASQPPAPEPSSLAGPSEPTRPREAPAETPAEAVAEAEVEVEVEAPALPPAVPSAVLSAPAAAPGGGARGGDETRARARAGEARAGEALFAARACEDEDRRQAQESRVFAAGFVRFRRG